MEKVSSPLVSSFGGLTMVLERSKPFLGGFPHVFVGAEGQSCDEDMFSSHIQHWIGGACEIIFTCTHKVHNIEKRRR